MSNTGKKSKRLMFCAEVSLSRRIADAAAKELNRKFPESDSANQRLIWERNWREHASKMVWC